MKQDIKLYISNQEVDFSSELSMPFTYQLKDVNNPTIIKNPFTKTINIVGTKNNNKIFGDIYNVNREQLFDAEKLVGAYYNPSIRTPFSIFRNGELIESGYMQLNSVTLKNKLINYEITLYGGLGDFFYSLMYNKNSEPLKLSDLVYGVIDEETGLPFEDVDREMDFTINKEFVYECFNNVGDDNGGLLSDYITFVPSYNGLPENFDSDKVLINTYKNSYWSGTTETTVDGKTYGTYNNYVLAQLPRKYTEWEMLDLRSYLQRPAIKMSKIIDACCNPANNGGYSVELDSDFFNSDNPYYNDAWVALPLLTNLEKEKNNITTAEGELYDTNFWVGNKNGIVMPIDTDALIPTSKFNVVDDYIDYTNVPLGTLTKAEIDVSVVFNSDEDYDLPLYLSVAGYGEPEWVPEFNDYAYPTKWGLSNVLLQLIVVDVDKDEIITYSDIMCLSTKQTGNIITDNTYKDFWKDYTPFTPAHIESINGYFKYDDTTQQHIFVTDNNRTNLNLTLDNIPHRSNIRIDCRIQRTYDVDGYFGDRLVKQKFYDTFTDLTKASNYITGYFSPIINSARITRDEPDSVVASNSKITKQFLLKTEKTPADYLLSYCKLFDLHFHKDNGEKNIKIQTRNNFYSGKILDWNDKIDYSKDFKIKPLMFDKKFYQMGLEGESYYLTKYKNEYAVEFGQKRINTNYNFNSETSRLLDGNVFQNAISATDTSPYYHTFMDKDDRLLAPFNNSNYKYQLFNVDNTNIVETTEVDYISPAIVAGLSWNRNAGYDAFAKTCFYTLENDEKSLSDISSVLLFYNGQVTPTDADSNNIRYKLSDDLPEMYTLNDKTPCYLFSNGTTDENNNTISYNCTILPQFLRYKIVGNQVQASWDFGVPKESYVPNITYNDNTTIYKQYWESYYNDALNINTKEVTCYVNLNDVNVNSELLHNFYYFNGCYWILNKIENFNINKYESTKCQFIRVNQLENYKNNIGVNEGL